MSRPGGPSGPRPGGPSGPTPNPGNPAPQPKGYNASWRFPLVLLFAVIAIAIVGEVAW